MKRMLALALLAALLCGCQSSETETTDSNVTTITMATWLGGDIYPSTQLVNYYNSIQNEIHVELVSYLENGVNLSKSDIKGSRERAYASFIAGDTPDIYDMVSFDETKLRNAGLIQDWYPIMQADPGFHMEEYQTHIWELLETDGRLYQLCASFDLFGIGGPVELYGDCSGWILEEFEAFLAEHSEEIGTTQKRMLQLMLWYGVQFDYIDWETKTCDFESKEFLNWLAFMQSLPQTAQTQEQVSPYYFQLVSYHGDWDPMSDSWQLVRYVGLPNTNADGPAVTISDSFALSATTEKADACWKFMKWLLSYETQKILYGEISTPYWEEEDSNAIRAGASSALPIHVDVWEELLDRAQLDSSHEESLFYGRGWYTVNEDGEWEQTLLHPGLPEGEVAYLRSLVANANRATVNFSYCEDVTEIIEEEVLAYLAGDKTAEECAYLIQERVSIMLAEMR